MASHALRYLPRALQRHKVLQVLNKARILDPVQLARFNGNAEAWVDLRDAESRAVYLSESFWPEFPPIVAAFLRSGGDLFDVGANFGLVTFGTLPLVNSARAHLFEANPAIIKCLEKTAKAWPNVMVSHSCVSDRHGVSYLTLPDACWGHGHMGASGQPISNLILDDYIEANGVERISFLKMDVEGWEVRALNGAWRALSSGKIETAFIELDPPSLSRAGTSSRELIALLQSVGFDLYFCGMWERPDPHSLRWKVVDVNGTPLRFAPAVPLPPSYASGDVLAVHRWTELRAAIADTFTQQRP